MKKMILSVFLSMMVGSSAVYAQFGEQHRKMVKESKAELNAKSTKAARKDAKKFQKEGWLTTPGTLPIEKQFDKSYLMQYEYDDMGYPRFIMAEAMSIGENYDAAKMQALELAKLNMAGQIQTEITALVKNSVSNQQLAAEEAVSVTKTVEAAKALISQKIGRLIPVVEVYRNKGNKNKEVYVRVAYNSAMAKAAAKAALRDGLEKENEDLHKKLDELLGW